MNYSLAHAGKVRGQTSKVAKQEKKKRLGQEVYAIQLALINVKPTFGKKKDPNANS